MENESVKNLFWFICFLLSVTFTFAQSRHISQKTKDDVYKRDKGQCQCCFSTYELEYDHIIPYSCGGTSDENNIQLLCRPCNRSKSNGCICKKHNKTVGRDCCINQKKLEKPLRSTSQKNKVQNSSFSNQCTATTLKGTRCKNKTKNINGKCHLHK